MPISKKKNNSTPSRPRNRARRRGAVRPVLNGAPRAAAAAAPRALMSASQQAYANVASDRASALTGKVSPYLSMVMDPHSKDKGVRYPDETIVPTGLVHLAYSTTYTVPAATSNFATALTWKCDIDNAGGADTSPIWPPGPVGAGPGYNDYGAPQATWAALSATDRTLAAGIRVRVIGLPTSTFMPSGTIYFIQAQASERLSLPSTEAAAIQAVTAGKGFSVTVNELSKADGVTIPYLPQGPMSFVFSDTNAEAPVTAGAETASTVVSANGLLWVVAFGLQPGQSFRIDYAHHIEYIPRVTAAGLIATRVEPPSSELRDAISRGAQAVQTNLAGATNLQQIRPLTDGGGAVLGQLAKVAVGMVPGGSLIAKGASLVANTFGAPAWLSSALNALA